MLFRNLKSGNVVAATDETSIELMQRSAIYEAVEIAPAVAPAPQRRRASAGRSLPRPKRTPPPRCRKTKEALIWHTQTLRFLRLRLLR